MIPHRSSNLDRRAKFKTPPPAAELSATQSAEPVVTAPASPAAGRGYVISHHQVQLIQIARRQTDLNELQYRTLLRNIGGVDSSRQLTQQDFEDVMAILEGCGFSDRHRGPMYWRLRADQRGLTATTRQIYKIHAMAKGSRYELPALCDKFSHGRTRDAGLLTPREAHELIEMFKAEEKREEERAKAAPPKRKPLDPNYVLAVPALTNDEIPF